MNRAFYLLLFGIIFVTGCATPPGKLQREDFVWEVKDIDASYQEVHRRLFFAFRTCGPNDGRLFATLIGIPDCFVDLEKKAVLCDVYVGSSHSYVLGQIHIESLDDKTSKLEVGTHKFGVDKNDTRKMWIEFAQGLNPCLSDKKQ